MLQKFKWAFRLFRTKLYVVIDDSGMVVNIPLGDYSDTNAVLLMSAQQASIQETISRLQIAQKEHKNEMDLLIRRLERDAKESSKHAPKKRAKRS
jgi:hypothetical protein